MVLSHKIEIFVHDANVLIDLANGKLLEAWFREKFIFVTSDFVFEELKKIQCASCLNVVGFSGEEIGEIYKIKEELSDRLSIQDISVLYLAKKQNGVLLTGDRLLKNKAEERKIKARGVLWVLDYLVENAGLDKKVAINSLDLILVAGARLPENECRKRRIAWGGTL